MKTWTNRFLLTLLMLFLSATVTLANFAPGDTVPDFEMTDIQGNSVRLSDYKGHPFILKLATTWCPSCKQQSQEFSEIEKFLAENNIPVIEVFVDDSKDEVVKYLEEHPLPGEQVGIVDDDTVYDKYNVYLIPRVLVVDSDFRVKRDGSVIESDKLKPMLAEMLN